MTTDLPPIEWEQPKIPVLPPVNKSSFFFVDEHTGKLIRCFTNPQITVEEYNVR